MKILRDITLGRYTPGDSFVHRLDPRLKLVGLPLLTITAFAMPSTGRLLLLFLVAGCLILASRLPAADWWRGVRLLRWLFLFSLLLHLFFSPGRTLFGLPWLSLDGLVLGIQVCWQLLLAFLFASILSLTTSPGQLASAITALLEPLRRFGLPVERLSQTMHLVLYFIPVLREEALAVVDAEPGLAGDMARGPLLARGKAAGKLVEPLVMRLADRADELACRLAAGEELVAPTRLEAFSAGAGGLWSLWGSILLVLGIFLVR